MIAKEFPSPFPDASPGKADLALPVCRGAVDVLEHARPSNAPPSLDPALLERWRAYLGRIGAPDAVGGSRCC